MKLDSPACKAYVNPRFITMFTRTKNGSYTKPVQFSLHAGSVFDFNIVHFNIIITFSSWYLKLFLLFRISTKLSLTLSFPHNTVHCV